MKIESKKIKSKLKSELEKNIDLKYKESSAKYFKEGIVLYGVRIPIIRKIANEYYLKIKELNKKEFFEVCETFVKTKYFEDMTIAFHWCYKYKKNFDEKDFLVFEKWLDKYVYNWALCDDLCNHLIGHYIESFPSVVPTIITWASSKNRWMKRGAAVSFVVSGRKGKNLKEILEVAKILLKDQDDLVQKGYGWALKETSRTHQKEVFEFLMKHKNKMPRTALRYAIEKMPKELKKKAMEK